MLRELRAAAKSHHWHATVPSGWTRHSVDREQGSDYGGN
jgi:hypothetical protein